MLTYESIPCWYELSWKGRDGKPGMLLRIHSDFASRTREIPLDAPGVLGFVQRFGLEKFRNKLGKNFGFEESLKYLGMANGFLEYKIPTPRIRKFTDNPCSHCDGKGWDKELDRDCLWCEKGVVSYYDWNAAFAVSASLTLLFRVMRFPEEETTATIPQLLCVDMVTAKGMHGGSLGGEYSCELAGYLRSRPAGEIPEMIAAMQAVFKRMEGKLPEFWKHSFQAYTQGTNGWLNVGCPGDAAGLHPADWNLDALRGYEFACHNVDQPMQQLALLASLAALHDLARAANR